MQRCVESLIGRLVTDEEFRRLFVADPEQVLASAHDCGWSFSAGEMAALVATDRTIWEKVADQIDPRLQKASLR